MNSIFQCEQRAELMFYRKYILCTIIIKQYCLLCETVHNRSEFFMLSLNTHKSAKRLKMVRIKIIFH